MMLVACWASALAMVICLIHSVGVYGNKLRGHYCCIMISIHWRQTMNTVIVACEVLLVMP